MKVFTTTLILLATCATAQAADFKSRVTAMPDDVRSWASRQAYCNYWHGEAPVDADRTRKIKESMNDYRCNDLARDADKLRQRYVNRANILDLLSKGNELMPD